MRLTWDSLENYGEHDETIMIDHQYLQLTDAAFTVGSQLKCSNETTVSFFLCVCVRVFEAMKFWLIKRKACNLGFV